MTSFKILFESLKMRKKIQNSLHLTFPSFPSFFIHQHPPIHLKSNRKSKNMEKLYLSLTALCHYAPCVSFAYTNNHCLTNFPLKKKQPTPHTDQATRMHKKKKRKKKFNAFYFISYHKIIYAI